MSACVYVCTRLHMLVLTFAHTCAHARAPAIHSGLMDFLGGVAGGARDYSDLKTGSFQEEAATYAKAREVKAVSKDGYSIATFGGGCFWGVELAYARVPVLANTLAPARPCSGPCPCVPALSACMRIPLAFPALSGLCTCRSPFLRSRSNVSPNSRA